MYETLSKCPLCEEENFQNKIICNDYLVSNKSFVIVHCQNCSFEFTNPRPKKEFIESFYPSKSYISHNKKIANPIDILYKIAQFFTLKKKLKLINKFSEKGHVLDFGCGIGSFLKICKSGGWQTTGVEPNAKARNIAEKIAKSRIMPNVNHLESKTKFEIITLWHVLEHLTNLNELINEFRQKLTKNGKLIVAVPNHKSYDQIVYKEHWAAYDVPRHLYHFDQFSMKAIMKKHQLKLIKIIPMKLDAYYISLLSEQHLNQSGKKSGNKYYKSIVNGYKSNVYAKNNNNNYSSLTYVFGK